MAVNIATAPERWLQGLDRLVAVVAEAVPIRPVRAGQVPTRWVLERGSVRASAPVDALGGFPGALRSAHRLLDVSLLVTDRYLVVGEGTDEGFALPLAQVVAAGLSRPTRQANPGLVIHFQDGSAVGSFALNFRGLPRGVTGRRRAEDVLGHLVDAGVRALPRMAYRAPRMAMSWDEAAEHAEESLIWTGHAIASVGGWYGVEQRPCRVWLTDDSLFWADLEGEGVNRLALTELLEARDGAGDRVRIATGDESGARFDLPFDFAFREPGINSSDQRHRFLNGLAAQGIMIGGERPALAPWRRGGVMRPTDRGR